MNAKSYAYCGSDKDLQPLGLVELSAVLDRAVLATKAEFERHVSLSELASVTKKQGEFKPGELSYWRSTLFLPDGATETVYFALFDRHCYVFRPPDDTLADLVNAWLKK